MVIFISYRRMDTSAVAEVIYRELASIYGGNNVFFDVCSIKLGDNFEEALCDSLLASDVFIPLIGENWIGIDAARPMPKINDQRDFVYREVVSAIRLKVTIVPLLIDQARMPDAEWLPADISAIRTMQGMSIQSTHLERQVRALARKISAAEHGRNRLVTGFTVVEEVFSREMRSADMTIAELARQASIRVDVIHNAVRGGEIKRGTASKIFDVIRKHRRELMFLDLFRAFRER